MEQVFGGILRDLPRRVMGIRFDKNEGWVVTGITHTVEDDVPAIHRAFLACTLEWRQIRAPQDLTQRKTVKKVGLRRGGRENAAPLGHWRLTEATTNRRRKRSRGATFGD